MLTLMSYGRYVKYGAKGFYLAALLFFIMGLMAKPMLVTLPFVLLLFDYWPLGRLNFKKRSNPVSYPHINISFFNLIIEKIPFFVFTAASCVVTFYAQRSGGSVASLEVFPLGVRIANAVVAYISYITKMFWPANLSAFYPHSYSLPMWQVAAAALLLMVVLFRDPFSGYRSDSGRRTGHGGPLYLCSADWNLYHSGMGAARFIKEMALSKNRPCSGIRPAFAGTHDHHLAAGSTLVGQH
jgi:hypothetical protein